MDKLIKTIHFYQDHFPSSEIFVGGIAATLLPKYIKENTGITPHIGLYREAEDYPPDYSLDFGRKLNASITFTTRGCKRKCKFCSVQIHEPVFEIKNNWEQDINLDLQRILFWDNNWLASPALKSDIEKIKKIGKTVDFNQGLDARFYTKNKAELLSQIVIDPIRFAFDSIKYEEQVISAIRLAKKITSREICVYVLYNYEDTPEDLFHRINLLNKEGALAFPMEYREPFESKAKFPRGGWDKLLLRAFKLSLLFYYRKGMITESRDSFIKIYGTNEKEFKNKLYTIYEYDKNLKRLKS